MARHPQSQRRGGNGRCPDSGACAPFWRFSRGFDSQTCTSTLAQMLQVESVSQDTLYRAMDWLLERQDKIEQRLAQQHLQSGITGSV